MTERSYSAVAARAWGMSSATALACKVITVGTTAVLARLLVPAHFGVVTMGVAVVGLVRYVADLGLGSGVVYVSRGELDGSAATLAAVSGLLGVLLLWAAAPAVAAFNREPALVPIFRFLSLHVLLDSVGGVPRAVLLRQMRYKALYATDLATEVANAVVSVSLAASGAGPWALVWGGLAAGTTRLLSYAWLSRLRPANPLSRLEGIRRMLRYGLASMGTGLATHAYTNADYIVIGRMLGKGPLGIYGKAFNAADFLVQMMSNRVGVILFPVFSAIREDRERVVSGLLRAQLGLALVAPPAFGALAVWAPVLVRVVLGGQWDAVVAPLRILCLYGFVRALLSPRTAVLYAVGRPRADMYLSIGQLLVVLALAILGARYGVVGVAAGVASGWFVWGLASLGVAAHMAGAPLGLLAMAVGLPTLAGAAFALVGLLPPWPGPSAVRALAGSVAGLLAWAFLTLAVRPPLARAGLDPWGLLLGILRGNREKAGERKGAGDCGS